MLLHDKAFKGVIKYLKLKNYEILDEDWDGFLVAFDNENGAIVFVNVIVSCDDLHEVTSNGAIPRSEFEMAMCHFFECKEDVAADRDVRYDVIIMSVSSGNRGIIKHHVQADAVLED